MSAFFDFFFFLFGNKNAEDIEKRRCLKQITKDIKSSRYKSFYRTRTKDVLPSFAGIMYELERTFNEFRSNLVHAENSKVLNYLIVEEFMSDNQKKLIESLKPENIKLESQVLPSYELEQNVKNSIEMCSSVFDEAWSDSVDQTYKQIISFIWLVNYDYFSLLQKLDTKFIIAKKYNPNFEKTNIMYLINDIKDFLSIAETIDPSKDWYTAFKILKQYNVTKLLSVNAWLGLLKRLNNVLSSEILSLMVRHGEGNPFWENSIILPHTKNSSTFLKKVINDANEELSNILNKSQTAQIDELLTKVFDTKDVPSVAKYYTSETEKNISLPNDISFDYVQAYNWMLAFESVFYNQISFICDTVIVYGEHNNKDSYKELSFVMQEISESHENLNNFDLMLSLGGTYGSKIKFHKAKIVQDATTPRSLNKIIKQINDDCFAVIRDELYHLKKISFFINKYAEMQNGILRGGIANWKTISKMLIENSIDINDLTRRLESFFNLMKYAGFDEVSGTVGTPSESI